MKDDARMRFGKAIKKARTESEMTLGDLAKAIDPGRLSKIENGLVNVTADVVDRIAEAMDLEVDLVFRFKKKKH